MPIRFNIGGGNTPIPARINNLVPDNAGQQLARLQRHLENGRDQGVLTLHNRTSADGDLELRRRGGFRMLFTRNQRVTDTNAFIRGLLERAGRQGQIQALDAYLQGRRAGRDGIESAELLRILTMNVAAPDQPAGQAQAFRDIERRLINPVAENAPLPQPLQPALLAAGDEVAGAYVRMGPLDAANIAGGPDNEHLNRDHNQSFVDAQPLHVALPDQAQDRADAVHPENDLALNAQRPQRVVFDHDARSDSVPDYWQVGPRLEGGFEADELLQENRFSFGPQNPINQHTGVDAQAMIEDAPGIHAPDVYKEWDPLANATASVPKSEERTGASTQKKQTHSFVQQRTKVAPQRHNAEASNSKRATGSSVLMDILPDGAGPRVHAQQIPDPGLGNLQPAPGQGREAPQPGQPHVLTKALDEALKRDEAE